MTDRNGSVTTSAPSVIGLMFLIVGAMAIGCDDPDVRFGPVGGLRVRGGIGGGDSGEACPYPPGTDETGATCPSWNDVIFPMLDEDGLYGCARDGCHGGAIGSNVGAANLTMPPGDADGSYDALAAYTRGDRPYIGEGLQSTAYLLCNIWPESPGRIDPIMPIPLGDEVPLFSGSDLVTVANWVACGMPKAGGAIVGAGGMGGMGGMGGAGGI
jgi:hypothetical protein